MKRSAMALFLLVICVLLSACSPFKELVHLSSKRELTKWCKNEFGKCTCVEFTKEEDKHIGRFCDTEKGFEYFARSYISDLNIDGSVFGYYEKKNSSFPDEYMSFFQKTYSDRFAELALEYSVDLNFNGYYSSGAFTWICTIQGSSEDSVISFAEELRHIMNEYDARGYWNSASYCLLVDDEHIGDYEKERGFVSSFDLESEWFIETAAREIQVPQRELKFLYRDVMKVSDIAGYDPQRVASILGSDNDTKTEAEVCYFEYEGKTYYIADLVQCNDGGSFYHIGTILSAKKQ